MHAKKDSLQPYRKRRDFTISPEPAGGTRKKTKLPIFVIQKHNASHLHYDFRLEIDGVLASWAVPKGISLDTADKRLAIRTEDHPLEYASFKGTIPEGQYGAGTVEIWDKGTYKNIKINNGKLVPMATCLEQGQIEIILNGKKADGAFALIRMQHNAKEQWLLIKMHDATTDDPPSATSITLDGHTIELSNTDKILFPKTKITKGDLIDYYQRIAPHMLPLMKDHLITMHRFPNGIDEEGFYQKNAGDYFPTWIKRKAVKKKDEGSVNYVIVTDTATLVYLANQGCITPHLWLSRIDKLRYPDRMIFDLDPSKPNDFDTIIATAHKLKTLLEKCGLHPFVMTTGSRGVHVITPLDRSATFSAVRTYAQKIARKLIADNPEHLTLEMRKEKRGDRVFIDTLRNAYGATGVAPYAVRAREGAPVATPIHWDELRHGLLPDQWNIKTIFKRLARIENPWKTMGKYAGNIEEATKRMKKL